MHYTTEKTARKQALWSHKKTFHIANSMRLPLQVTAVLHIGKNSFVQLTHTSLIISFQNGKYLL